MRRLDEQADALLEREPDVVCLQEVTATTLPRWRERLTAFGLGDVRCLVPEPPRRLAVLLAARELGEAAPVATPRPRARWPARSRASW